MSRVEVPMPQMGESIAEGTVSKWLKKVGDEVTRDEPLLEISTDKVDAEIPSPSAGTIVEIVVSEGETVEVGTVVAFIETEKGATPPKAEQKSTQEPEREKEKEREKEREKEKEKEGERETDRVVGRAVARAADDGRGANGREETAEERLRKRSTPVVRRIAAEHGVDLADVKGTGQAGRVTKQDIMAFLEGRGAEPARAPAREPGVAVEADDLWKMFYGQVRHPEFPVRTGDRVEPMDRIRRLTADHMVRAKRIAPHVHSFIEVDFTQVDRVRNRGKARWQEQGVKVSFTAFVAWAVARILPRFPMVNATLSGDSILYRGEVNIGIAVDLNPGLIVPVVRNADDLNLTGIAKRITDLAQRARDRKLKPDEIQGATFSITNPGVLGTMVGMPIIPEGTSAILGTGAIEKRPVVVEADGMDAIVVRKRSWFSMGYDHRLVDGADAARFLAALKEALETFPEDAA